MFKVVPLATHAKCASDPSAAAKRAMISLTSTGKGGVACLADTVLLPGDIL